MRTIVLTDYEARALCAILERLTQPKGKGKKLVILLEDSVQVDQEDMCGILAKIVNVLPK